MTRIVFVKNTINLRSQEAKFIQLLIASETSFENIFLMISSTPRCRLEECMIKVKSKLTYTQLSKFPK